MIKRIKLAIEARLLPNSLYMRRRFKEKMGRTLDLEQPKTFSEKIQWLKLNYRNPILSKLACKYESKEIVEQKVGKKYVMPTHSLFEKSSDIKLNSIPSKVALKATHGSGWNIISMDKSELKEKEVQDYFDFWLGKSYYLYSKEWAYKNIKPRVIVEELVLEGDNELPKDYKIHCFSGQPKFIQVDHQRYKKHTRSYYDEFWNKKNFSHAKPIHPEIIERPKLLEDMLRVAHKLSSDLPYLRVDFFYVNNKIYVGELTCYPGNGMEKFSDEKWDFKMGEMLDLPEGRLKE